MTKQFTRPLFFIILAACLLSACGAGYTIRGKVVDKCTDTGKLAQAATVSLAPLQGTNDFKMKLVNNQWQGETAAAETDSSGSFTFKNISDGQYGLFLLGAQVPDGPDKSLILTVKKGSSQNLGDIQLVNDAQGNCQVEYKKP